MTQKYLSNKMKTPQNKNEATTNESCIQTECSRSGEQ